MAGIAEQVRPLAALDALAVQAKQRGSYPGLGTIEQTRADVAAMVEALEENLSALQFAHAEAVKRQENAFRVYGAAISKTQLLLARIKPEQPTTIDELGGSIIEADKRLQAAREVVA